MFDLWYGPTVCWWETTPTHCYSLCASEKEYNSTLIGLWSLHCPSETSLVLFTAFPKGPFSMFFLQQLLLAVECCVRGCVVCILCGPQCVGVGPTPTHCGHLHV